MSAAKKITVGDTIEAVDELIQRVGRLHSSPTIAQKVLSLTRSLDFSMDEVVTCLQCDPALAARILRVVNSSRYGLGHQIGSIRHAAIYLGQRSLRLFSVTFALVETLTTGDNREMYSNYWQRALTMASVAAYLIRRRDKSAADDAYTAGLLADVGILIFAQFKPKKYIPIYEKKQHGPELVEAEVKQFGFPHQLLGARLLQNWDLPDAVVSAVADHHSTDDDGDFLKQAVRAGNLTAESLIDPTEEKLRSALNAVESGFGLNYDHFLVMATECLHETDKSTKAFGGSSFPPGSCERFHEVANELQVQMSS